MAFSNKPQWDAKSILKEIWNGKPIEQAVPRMYNPIVWTSDYKTFYIKRMDGRGTHVLTEEELDTLCKKFGSFLILSCRDEDPEESGEVKAGHPSKHTNQ